MTATNVLTSHGAHVRYDAAPHRPSKGMVVAIAVTAIVHGAIFGALVTTRFAPFLQHYVEDKTDVLLQRPPQAAPPPPPVKAPPVKSHPAPPVVQPRPPAEVATRLAAPAPLYIAPVETPRPQIAAPPVVTEPAPAPSSPTPPRHAELISNPDWVSRPGAAEAALYYPERALRMNISGQTTLHCRVTVRGYLEQCAVTSESPSDQGFGAASLKLSRLFIMRPQVRDGHAVGGAQIDIPMRFTPPID